MFIFFLKSAKHATFAHFIACYYKKKRGGYVCDESAQQLDVLLKEQVLSIVH